MSSMKNNFTRLFLVTVGDSLLVLLPIPLIAIPLLFLEADPDYVVVITVLASIVLMTKNLWAKSLTTISHESFSHQKKYYDVFLKPIDSFALGAITAQADESDLLSSSEVAKLAAKIYADSKK